MAENQETKSMGTDREDAAPILRFSDGYLEALEGYSLYCAELAREGREGATLDIEPPPWQEYLTEYLLSELDAMRAS